MNASERTVTAGLLPATLDALDPLEQIGGSGEFLALDVYNMGFLDVHAMPLTSLVSTCFALFWTNIGAIDVGARIKL